MNNTTYLPISKAAKEFFPFPVSANTVRNWTKTGKKGVILRSDLGMICQEDVLDFLDELSEKTDGHPSLIVARICAARLGFRP